jgi:hypothetical protein
MSTTAGEWSRGISGSQVPRRHDAGFTTGARQGFPQLWQYGREWNKYEKEAVDG